MGNIDEFWALPYWRTVRFCGGFAWHTGLLFPNTA
jgi:hypothetical protein